jgi:hypothetical protein
VSSHCPVSQLRWSVAFFPLWRSRFYPRPGHVGFVMGNVALRKVFSKLTCQFLFHLALHTGLSPRAGTITQIVTELSNEPRLTTSHVFKNILKNRKNYSQIKSKSSTLITGWHKRWNSDREDRRHANACTKYFLTTDTHSQLPECRAAVNETVWIILFISVGGWIDFRAIVQPEELGKLEKKNPPHRYLNPRPSEF